MVLLHFVLESSGSCINIGHVGDCPVDQPHWHPSWKKDHQTEQKLNENDEAKWVPGPSSPLFLLLAGKGESEGVKLCHGGQQGSGVCKGMRGGSDDQ